MNLKKIKKKDICLFSAPHYFLNHLKNKQNFGKLKIIFTTSGVESSMELLLSSVCLFSFDDDR